MTEILVAPKYDLSPAELATIVRVAKETAESGSLPIATVRGPETRAALARYFPANESWDIAPRLGTQRTVNPRGTAAITGSPGLVAVRRVEVLFKGSKRYPDGVPVGTTDHYTLREVGGSERKHTASVFDISAEEMRQLRCLAEGKRYMTQEQIAADAQMKDEARQETASEAHVPMDKKIAAGIVEAFGKVLGTAAPAETPPAPPAGKGTR